MSALAFKLGDGGFRGQEVKDCLRIGLRYRVHTKFLLNMPDLRATLVLGIRRACQSPPTGHGPMFWIKRG